jgi:hypothetical protein
MTRLDTEKLRMRRIVATAAITAVAIASLLLSNAFAAVSATQAALAPRAQAQALDEQVANVRGEAEQTPAGQAPREAAAASGLPGDRAVDQISLSEPNVPPDAEISAPGASEQRVFKSRRALETINPRDFVRQAAMPK